MSSRATRLKRHGFTVACIEFKCPKCKRRLNCSESEVPQLKAGQTPLCYDCLLAGVRVPMQVRRYTSGPIDLRV